MAATVLVQVKLRITEGLRRQVLATAKKSGRSLNGELNYLIEQGLAKPEYEALIKSAAESAAIAAASRMAETISRAMLEKTSQGLVTLKAVAESTAASIPNQPLYRVVLDPAHGPPRQKDETK
jgi:hypothetical protein